MMDEASSTRCEGCGCARDDHRTIEERIQHGWDNGEPLSRDKPIATCIDCLDCEIEYLTPASKKD